MHIQVLGIFISRVGGFWPQSWALDLLHSLYKMLGHGIPKKNPYHKTKKMFGKNCPPKKYLKRNLYHKKQETSLPKTSLKQSSYPKFPEEEVSTKKSLKRHSLPKNVWREIPTKHICQKSLQKKYIWRDRRDILYHSFEEHLYQKKWRELPTKKNWR